MRKFILALAALLSLPGACYAAFAIFQTYAGPPQIFYNIVTDGGANCTSGDGTLVNRVVTFAVGSPNVSVTVDTFLPGDVGKYIIIPNANLGSNYRTIQTVTDPQNIVLNGNVFANVSGVATNITYGFDDTPAFMTNFRTWALANQGTNNQVVLTIPAGKACWFGSSISVNFGGTVNVQNAFAAGIKNLIVEGNSSSISQINGGGLWLGNIGRCKYYLTDATNGCTARLKTVSAGAYTVELTSASYSAGYISRFSVGQWVEVDGLNMQTLFLNNFGEPANLTYFERRQIVSICNNTGSCVGTATITLDGPLTNSYLDTWPLQGSDTSGIDQGGPATIASFGGTPNYWGGILEYRNLTIRGPDNITGPTHSLTLRNVTFPVGRGLSPSEMGMFAAYNTTWPGGTVEPDKLVDTIILDGVTGGTWLFQSNSINVTNFSNTTFNSLSGGGRTSTMTDVTIGSWNPGEVAYGAGPRSITCTRCNVATLMGNGDLRGSVFMSQAQVAQLSMSSGVIQWSRSLGEYQRWASYIGANFSIGNTGSTAGRVNNFQLTALTADPWPAVDNQTLTTTISITSGLKALNVPAAPFVSGDVGKTIIINGAGGSGGQLKTYITAFTDTANVTVFDAASTTVSAASQQIQWGTSNFYAQTSMPAGFPTPSGCCEIVANPAPIFTCTDPNAASDPIFISLCTNAGASPGIAMGEWTRRTYAPTSGPVTNLGKIYPRGLVTSITIDVTTAYNGAGSATNSPFGQSHYFAVKQSDWTDFDWLPLINLKTAGIRSYTFAGGWTCDTGGGPVAGGCSGDTVTGAGVPPEQVWLRNDFQPSINNSITCGGVTGFDCPVWTMTAQANQGVVN